MKQIPLSKVPIGGKFQRFGDSFIVLDRSYKGALVIRNSIYRITEFDDTNCNDFRKADISNHLYDYYSNILRIKDKYAQYIKKQTIDLKATDGTVEYGTYETKVGLLTLEQYGRYQHIIPILYRDWWLATPYSTPSSKNGHDFIVWAVDEDGGIALRDADSSAGIRFTLLLDDSLLVDITNDKESLIFLENEQSVYMEYRKYLFDWLEENNPIKKESPLSYEAWKATIPQIAELYNKKG